MDVNRAFFSGMATRKLSVELPPQDPHINGVHRVLDALNVLRRGRPTGMARRRRDVNDCFILVADILHPSVGAHVRK